MKGRLASTPRPCSPKDFRSFLCLSPHALDASPRATDRKQGVERGRRAGTEAPVVSPVLGVEAGCRCSRRRGSLSTSLAEDLETSRV